MLGNLIKLHLGSPVAGVIHIVDFIVQIKRKEFQKWSEHQKISKLYKVAIYVFVYIGYEWI